MQDVPFPDQLRIMGSVSILVMVHGSAIALWPFLPPKAVAIHISPDAESTDSLQRVWAEAYVSRRGGAGGELEEFCVCPGGDRARCVQTECLVVSLPLARHPRMPAHACLPAHACRCATGASRGSALCR